MTRKTKGRAYRNQATPKTSKIACSPIGFTSRIKAVIVTLALWGWLPVVVAVWLIHRGGLRNA